nr:hypothetical protein [uncultured Chryseobacterium sp.]
MKKTTVIFLFHLFGLSHSQYVDIIEKGKKENLSPQEFVIPLKNVENYKSAFVGRYKAHYSNTYLGHLFTSVAEEAKKAGANAYHIVSFKEGGQDAEAELVLDTYYIEDSDIQQQSEWAEKNKVYIIGEPVINSDNTSKFKVNGGKKRSQSQYILRNCIERK